MKTEVKGQKSKKLALGVIQAEIAKILPKIGNLEKLSGLNDLTLVEFAIEEKLPVIRMIYTALAPDELYPHTRARMIERGVIKKSDVLGIRDHEPDGSPAGYEEIRMMWDNKGVSVQTYLRVFPQNPKYQKYQQSKHR